MEEIVYKIVENLGYDTKDKKQTVIGEITETEYKQYFQTKSNTNNLVEEIKKRYEGFQSKDEYERWKQSWIDGVERMKLNDE